MLLSKSRLDALQEHLQMMTAMRQQGPYAKAQENWPFKSMEEFVLKNGQAFEKGVGPPHSWDHVP